MDLYEAIKGRRSIRRFKPDPVPKDVLDRIFEMATWAPSGMNLQNWYFVVALIPIGYPDESPPSPKRKPNRVVYEGF